MLLYKGKPLDFANITEKQKELLRKAIQPSFDVDQYSIKNIKWLFRLFKLFYQKDYSNSFEESTGFENFTENLKFINKINSENKSFRIKINEYADLEESNKPKGFKRNQYRDSNGIQVIFVIL
jgi:hypothetical protein